MYSQQLPHDYDSMPPIEDWPTERNQIVHFDDYDYGESDVDYYPEEIRDMGEDI